MNDVIIWAAIEAHVEINSVHKQPMEQKLAQWILPGDLCIDHYGIL